MRDHYEASVNAFLYVAVLFHGQGSFHPEEFPFTHQLQLRISLLYFYYLRLTLRRQLLKLNMTFQLLSPLHLQLFPLLSLSNILLNNHLVTLLLYRTDQVRIIDAVF